MRLTSPFGKAPLLALLLVLFVACGETSTPTKSAATPTDTAAADSAGDDALAADAGADAAEPAPDVAADVPEDIATLPDTADTATPDAAEVGADTADVAQADGSCGEAGCTCSDNTTCNSGQCIEVDDHKQCAALCTGSGCAEGFKCVQLAAAGGDITNVCVPLAPRLCEPCTADSDCNTATGGADSRCLIYKDDAGALVGQFCGVGCVTSGDCPSGYLCKDKASVSGLTTKQCVKTDLQCGCDARAKKLALSTPCSSVNAVGTCGGKRYCGAAGLSSCDAESAKAEACNQQDDDCDGQTDEASAGMCDDGNMCTYDNCFGGECQHPTKGGPCDDGDACTSGEVCISLDCKGSEITCDDKNPCTIDTCDKAKGCQYVAQDGASCSDGDACTSGDVCKGDVCQAGAAVDCDDKNLCTNDSCSAKAGCVNANNTAACSDDDVCTLVDVCKDAACVPGKAMPCVDGNPCTDDSCDKAKGCVFADNNGTCSDNNVCTAGDACKDGLCVPGGQQDCDDGNPCTADTCDFAKGCKHIAGNQPCDDGSVCTLGDTCADGKCLAGKAITCDDGNPCTTDTCDKASGCGHSNTTDPCDDNNACTSGDTCKNGVCTPVATSPCDDKNPCTTETCDTKDGCQSVVNTLPCSDDSVCTLGDACSGGLCMPGALIDCDDGNPCTNDSCDASKGCVHSANAAPCSDGNVCTVGDVCAAKVCSPGVYVKCDDGNQCTDDSCDAKSGCAKENNSASCSDGSVCTVGDVCKGGACQAGSGVVCNDGNPCTDDSCDAVQGCKFATNTAPCYDNNGCTAGDTCTAGKCLATQGCDAKALCTPGQGAVACKCTSGYAGDGFTCSDVDECATGAANCGANMACSNTPGSFACTCSANFADCDGQAANGCEVNTLTNAANCGGCGKACSASNIAAPSCAAGVCNGTCSGGFADCNSNKLVDGCETTTSNDVNNCGGCNNKCAGGQVCSASQCVSAAQTFTFTSCGTTGKTGPSQTACNNVYTPGNTLSGKVTVSSGVQAWTVPYTGNYTITVFGAQGGNDPYTWVGGLGARMSGTFALTAGQTINILVGQQGTPVNGNGNSANGGAGGGGGTFVSVNSNLLIAAGGGGGSCLQNNGENACRGKDGVTTTAGSQSPAPSAANQGDNGNDSSCVTGGKGWNTVKSTPTGANDCGGYSSGGGFGGGGGPGCGCGGNFGHTAGGGGGYSGGGGGTSSYYYAGGGGGSYNSGSNQNNAGGVQAGDGKVTIVGPN